VSLTGATSSGALGLLHFDLAVEFCVARDEGLSGIVADSGAMQEFETRFQVQAGKFQAFRAATIRLLEAIVPLQPTTATATTSRIVQLEQERLTIRLKSSANEFDSSDQSSGSSEGDMVVIAVTWSMLVMFIGVLIFVIFKMWRHKRASSEVQDFVDEDFEGKSPRLKEPFDEGDAVDGMRKLGQCICTVHGFSATEVEVDEDFHGHILTLSDGDVVELLAGSRGWYYGHVVGNSARKGYFPESRVASWLTWPAETTLPACTAIQQMDIPAKPGTPEAGEASAKPGDWLDDVSAPEGELSLVKRPPIEVCETREFHPEELQDFGGDGADMLTLNHGDVVEVLDKASGWLYGRILGAPERAGYFPEGLVISWISRPPDSELLQKGTEDIQAECQTASMAETGHVVKAPEPSEVSQDAQPRCNSSTEVQDQIQQESIIEETSKDIAEDKEVLEHERDGKRKARVQRRAERKERKENRRRERDTSGSLPSLKKTTKWSMSECQSPTAQTALHSGQAGDVKSAELRAAAESRDEDPGPPSLDF